MNHHASGLFKLGKIAVRPDAREAFEIGLAVALPVGIIPETNRRRGKRPGANQLAFFLEHGIAGLVENFDRHAEAATLQFTTSHRQQRVRRRKTAKQVGATGDRAEQHIAFDCGIDEIETLRRQRRTGRQDGAHARYIELVRRSQPGFLQCRQVFRTGTEYRDALAFRHRPQRAAFVDERCAVEQDQRRPCQQPTRQPVPHHPATGREIENAIIGVDIRMQQELVRRASTACRRGRARYTSALRSCRTNT